MYKAHQESSFDCIKRKWVEACTSVRTVAKDIGILEHGTLQDCNRIIMPGAEMGWALKKSKTKARFSDNVKEYLKK